LEFRRVLCRSGVGRRLKVGEETVGRVELREDGDAALQLGADRGARQTPIWAEAAVVAKHAAAHSDAAVHVRTGEAGVDGDACDAAAEALPQEPAERIVAPRRSRLLRKDL